MNDSFPSNLPQGAQPGEPEAQPAAPEPPAPVIPWERRRRKGRLWDYWKTAFLVLRRNGRLGEYLAGPVSYGDAQKFRWLTIAHAAVWPTTAALVLLLIALAAWSMEMDASPTLWGALVLSVGAALQVAVMAGTTGVTSWFFCPRRYDTERQNRSIALSYYTCAPLGLMVFSLVPLLIAVPFVDDWPTLLPVFTAFAGTVSFYWFQLELFAVNSVAGRGVGGVLTTAFLLPALWALVKVVVIWGSLAGVPMLVLMFASLD